MCKVESIYCHIAIHGKNNRKRKYEKEMGGHNKTLPKVIGMSCRSISKARLYIHKIHKIYVPLFGEKLNNY
ncbi:hypothetical protein NEPAR04_1443 [Nematocida parisii]|nr:hypothetical protein NEPAR04_1443 [Nematocida parisii]